MEKTENLYNLLNNMVSERLSVKIEESPKSKEEEENIYSANQIKAYFYYKYFIVNMLPIYIKNCISDFKKSPFSIKAINSMRFNASITVFYNEDNETYIEKTSLDEDDYFFSVGDFTAFQELVEYIYNFCERCGLSYDMNDAGNSYSFNEITIYDMLKVYYDELQRFQYTDELIASIQEEENTNVNGEELINKIIRR